MKDLTDVSGVGQRLARTRGSKFANADDPLGPKKPNDLTQMTIADLINRRAFRARKLIRGAVAAALLQECERTIIGDEMFLEKFLGRSIPFREQPPQASTADLSAMTIEAEHRPLNMLMRRTMNFGPNS